MIGTISVEIQAANPSMPLFPLRAFINSPTSLRIRNVPKKIGNWSITKVYVSAAYPDNSIQSTECVLVGGVWVGTIAGSSMAGSGGDGYTVYADGIDENGEPVAGYILGKGQVEILSTDTISPGVVQYYVHLLEDGDVERHLDGDLWKDAETGAWLIWQDGQAWAVGDDTGLIDELKERVDALDSTASELSADVAALNASMVGVGERLDGVDSTVSGLIADLGVVDGKVVALEGDVDEIDSSLSEISANVEALAGDVALKADASAVYTKSQVDSQMLNKADASRLNDYELKSDLSGDVSNIVTETEDIFSEWTFNQEGNYSIVEQLDTSGEYPLWIYILKENGEDASQTHSEERLLSIDWDSARPDLVSTRQKIGEKNKLGLVSYDELDSTASELHATILSEMQVKADKVKEEQVLVDAQVPSTIQFWAEAATLELSAELREQDPQHRVWWVWYEYVEEFDFHFKGWVCYDPVSDANGVAPALIGWNTSGNVSGQGHMFPWEYGDGQVEQMTMWGDNPDYLPTRIGLPPTGYDHWYDYFASQAANRKMYAVQGAGTTPYYDIYIYGYVTLHILPSTVSYNVIYENDMNETLEDYAPLQKNMTYEGDVLVPNKIDGTWASMDPSIGTLDLNASYMSQDTQKRVWWSAQVQYEPEPSTILYIYAVACYDATNDTFKANVWHDEQSGLPQNISDLGDPDEWVSFSRASGWTSWRDFFYNAPDDEYYVSYGQTTNIDLFDHAFVKARWGGLFDVVYEGELVNAYATRQYVDEQIGNILTEEF